MATSARIAPDSLLSVDDQERLYREQMGAERAAAQVRARRIEQGRCVCTPRSVSKRWEGADRPTRRSVHDADCPRYKAWMGS